MSDLISRQAAIDTLRGYLVGERCPDDGTLTCRLIENEVINKLPPAQPKREKWIHISEEMWKCDQCGEISCCSPNFCPDCGADMREVTI